MIHKEENQIEPCVTTGEILSKALTERDAFKKALADFYVAAVGGPSVSGESILLARAAAFDLGFWTNFASNV